MAKREELGPVRRVIRNPKTGKYYAGNGKWTGALERAKELPGTATVCCQGLILRPELFWHRNRRDWQPVNLIAQREK